MVELEVLYLVLWDTVFHLVDVAKVAKQTIHRLLRVIDLSDAAFDSCHFCLLWCSEVIDGLFLPVSGIFSPLFQHLDIILGDVSGLCGYLDGVLIVA